MLRLFVLASALALSACASDPCDQHALSHINFDWNHRLIHDDRPTTKPPTLADVMDDHANCYEFAIIKKAEMNARGCTSHVLLGHVANGDGHALLQVTNKEGVWYMDSRPGTDLVTHSMRDFVPVVPQ